MASRQDETLQDGPDMRNEANRRWTFENWESVSTHPAILAEAGFFYLGCGDRVRCHCCGGELGCWWPTDDVLERHIRNYPHCRFAKTVLSGTLEINIAAHASASYWFPPSVHQSPQMYSPCETPQVPEAALLSKRIEAHTNDSMPGAETSYQWSHYCSECYYCRRRFFDCDHDADAWEKLANWFPGFAPTTSRHTGRIESDASPIVNSTTSDAEQGPSRYVFIPDSTVEAHRLASFATAVCQYDVHIRQAAEHGFFFTGMMNIAKCFSCGAIWSIHEREYSRILHATDCQMKDLPGEARNVPLASRICLRQLMDELMASSQRRPVATSGVQTAVPGPDEPKNLPTSYPPRNHPQSP